MSTTSGQSRGLFKFSTPTRAEDFNKVMAIVSSGVYKNFLFSYYLNGVKSFPENFPDYIRKIIQISCCSFNFVDC